VLRGAFREESEREGERERERERKREREGEGTQSPVYRRGIIDISNCFDGEEVHRPARPGPARPVATQWDGTRRDEMGWDGMGCDVPRFQNI